MAGHLLPAFMDPLERLKTVTLVRRLVVRDNADSENTPSANGGEGAGSRTVTQQVGSAA